MWQPDYLYNARCGRRRKVQVNHAKHKEDMKLKMVHVGRRIPKKLLDDGWIEWQAIHHGNGLWSFCLEKEIQKHKTEEQMSKKHI